MLNANREDGIVTSGEITARRGRFPLTRHSWLEAARSPDAAARRAAWGNLVESYWTPVYKYLRLAWHFGAADAEELTQEFFAGALAGGLGDYDPRRGRFRTYLRVCVDGFAGNQRKAAARLKRGGGIAPLSLDFARAEDEVLRLDPALRAGDADPEELFHQEWVRSLLALAVEALASECAAGGKAVHFELFERYDLEGPAAAERPTYAQLGAELGLPVSQVTNYLAAVRRDFRRLVLAKLREATASDAEYRAEARQLLGVTPGEERAGRRRASSGGPGR
jgi:RNA polymerase sigma factor (sigma-70 family)